MKKLLLSIMMCATTLLTFGQTAELMFDKTDSDGFRVITTKAINCRNGMSDKHPMLFSISRFSKEDKVSWSIDVDFTDMTQFKIPQGATMLIKLNDDQIIELKQTRPTNDTEDLVGNYNSTANLRIYTMHGSYEVTEDQLQIISGTGIKKIRIERQLDSFDTEYKKDKVAPILKEQYQLVKNAALKKDNKSDF